jgi:hypothetical protein
MRKGSNRMSELELARQSAQLAMIVSTAAGAAPTPYVPLSLREGWAQILAWVIVVVGCAALAVAFVVERVEHPRSQARSQARSQVTSYADTTAVEEPLQTASAARRGEGAE